jgi:flotillin
LLDTLKIQNVTDEVNYLSSAGRIRAPSSTWSKRSPKPRHAPTFRTAGGQLGSQRGRQDRRRPQISARAAKRIADTTSRREAMIQEARGQVTAQIAQVKAEIERQKARALQEKRRLDADIVQPAIAKQRASEEQARGAAASTIERGRAEAGSLRELIESYKTGGTASRDVLALQNLLPLLTHVSGAHHSLSINKMSVLPTSDSAGSEFARKAIGTSEQIRRPPGSIWLESPKARQLIVAVSSG